MATKKTSKLINDPIPHVIRQDLKTITVKTLKRFLPEAHTKAQEELESEDLVMIWFMAEKPVQVNPGTEENYGTDEEWTQTNEPELAERVAEDWDRLAATVNGQKLVVLCGSWDDEYGRIWNATSKEWEHYMY